MFLLIGKSVLIIMNIFHPRSVEKGIMFHDVGYLQQDILKLIKFGVYQPKMIKHKEEKYNHCD